MSYEICFNCKQVELNFVRQRGFSHVHILHYLLDVKTNQRYI